MLLIVFPLRINPGMSSCSLGIDSLENLNKSSEKKHPSIRSVSISAYLLNLFSVRIQLSWSQYKNSTFAPNLFKLVNLSFIGQDRNELIVKYCLPGLH